MTFDDAMLDWATAELLSPIWADKLNLPACQTLREKLRSQGIDSLSNYEKTWLVGLITQFRSAIISIYGPCRSWKFWRTSIRVDQLRTFAIIHHFGCPTYSFGDLCDAVLGNPSANEDMRKAVLAIGAGVSNGSNPYGLPIAITQPTPLPPLLIEGYKRLMATISGKQTSSVEMILCSP